MKKIVPFLTRDVMVPSGQASLDALQTALIRPLAQSWPDWVAARSNIGRLEQTLHHSRTYVDVISRRFGSSAMSLLDASMPSSRDRVEAFRHTLWGERCDTLALIEDLLKSVGGSPPIDPKLYCSVYFVHHMMTSKDIHSVEEAHDWRAALDVLDRCDERIRRTDEDVADDSKIGVRLHEAVDKLVQTMKALNQFPFAYLPVSLAHPPTAPLASRPKSDIANWGGVFLGSKSEAFPEGLVDFSRLVAILSDHDSAKASLEPLRAYLRRNGMPSDRIADWVDFAVSRALFNEKISALRITVHTRPYFSEKEVTVSTGKMAYKTRVIEHTALSPEVLFGDHASELDRQALSASLSYAALTCPRMKPGLVAGDLILSHYMLRLNSSTLEYGTTRIASTTGKKERALAEKIEIPLTWLGQSESAFAYDKSPFAPVYRFLALVALAGGHGVPQGLASRILAGPDEGLNLDPTALGTLKTALFTAAVDMLEVAQLHFDRLSELGADTAAAKVGRDQALREVQMLLADLRPEGTPSGSVPRHLSLAQFLGLGSEWLGVNFREQVARVEKLTRGAIR